MCSISEEHHESCEELVDLAAESALEVRHGPVPEVYAACSQRRNRRAPRRSFEKRIFSVTIALSSDTYFYPALFLFSLTRKIICCTADVFSR